MLGGITGCNITESPIKENHKKNSAERKSYQEVSISIFKPKSCFHSEVHRRNFTLCNHNKHVVAPGGDSNIKGWGCSSRILKLTPKGEQTGRGSRLF